MTVPPLTLKTDRRFPSILVVLALGLVSIGCVSAQKQVKTQHFTLAHPDFWEVKSVGVKEGEPTTVIIKNFGTAVIDDGSGAIDERSQNYEAVQADVEVRVYAWPEPAGAENATSAAAQMLQGESTLELNRHLLVSEQPPECGLLKKKYTIVGVKEEPFDLVSRPGWRTILIGGKKQGILLGVVARVPYEQDVGRFCHNLSNMQVQLQNLLDGLVVIGGRNATAPPSTPAPTAS